MIPFTALAENLGDTMSNIYWPCLMGIPGVCWWDYGPFITGTLDVTLLKVTCKVFQCYTYLSKLFDANPRRLASAAIRSPVNPEIFG